MLQRVDRIQVVVPDSAAAVEMFGAVLGAEPVREDSVETLRAHRDAAVQTIEAWRSMNANQRAAERGYGSHR